VKVVLITPPVMEVTPCGLGWLAAGVCASPERAPFMGAQLLGAHTSLRKAVSCWKKPRGAPKPESPMAIPVVLAEAKPHSATSGI
jgi:hypothetical protein